jgi:hypothetical protein
MYQADTCVNEEMEEGMNDKWLRSVRCDLCCDDGVLTEVPRGIASRRCFAENASHIICTCGYSFLMLRQYASKMNQGIFLELLVYALGLIHRQDLHHRPESRSI